MNKKKERGGEGAGLRRGVYHYLVGEGCGRPSAMFMVRWGHVVTSPFRTVMIKDLCVLCVSVCECCAEKVNKQGCALKKRRMSHVFTDKQAQKPSLIPRDLINA